MRRFVVVLAGFGLVLLSLTAAAYLYFQGQIPPVQVETERFVLRADPGVTFKPLLGELRTATERFDRLVGPRAALPRLEVAIIDDAKQMNAVTLYVAIRQSMGTPSERLPLPYPTPRLVSLLLGEPESTADMVTRRRGLGHEVGHWLLRLSLLRREEGTDGPNSRETTLPGWLREGIAGYCEPTERRIGALLRVRANRDDSTGAMTFDLERLLAAEPPETPRPAWAQLDARVNGSAYEEAENYYAQALLLVEYLEAVHPSTVRKWLLRGITKDEIRRDPLLRDPDALRTWILTVPPLTL